MADALPLVKPECHGAFSFSSPEYIVQRATKYRTKTPFSNYSFACHDGLSKCPVDDTTR